MITPDLYSYASTEWFCAENNINYDKYTSVHANPSASCRKVERITRNTKTQGTGRSSAFSEIGQRCSLSSGRHRTNREGGSCFPMTASNHTPQKRKSPCANTGIDSVKKLRSFYAMERRLQDAIGCAFPSQVSSTGLNWKLKGGHPNDCR